MFGFLRKLFGSNHERQIKTLMPTVAKINEEYQKLALLSHDALRQKTLEFRQRIQAHLKNIDAEIQQVKDSARSAKDVNKKQALFEQVDKLVKVRDQEIEKVLSLILPEAFAVVKETARRFTQNEVLEVTATPFDEALAAKGGENCAVSIENGKALWRNSWVAAGNRIKWDMIHYDVQLLGGIVLHLQDSPVKGSKGNIAEMATGEGKTLVATLPAYLNGLTGEGVHIVTVNDYLAKRDSEWMGPLLQFLFLTIDCIDKYRPHSHERKQAYLCDVTYGTNNEFGFDYLRDNMVHTPDDVVQKKFHYAMVDEVDSVLIDDARTPLIISGPTVADNSVELFKTLKLPVERIVEEQRRIVGEFLKEARKKIAEGNTSHEEGGGGLALLRAHRGLPKNRALIKFLSEPGVQTILRNTENYYLQENEKNMPKADAPLFFVIEEKNNNVELTDKGAEFLGRGSNDANLFVMDDIGSILAEIEKSKLEADDKVKAKSEALQRFTIKNERLHALQQLLKAYTLFEKEDEYVLIDGKVKIVDKSTGRIMEGRRYSDGLHQAIEAKEGVHIEEPSQTYATVTLQNFFRMYHKIAGMTGTAETEAQELWDIYKLNVVVIPTNRKIQRKDHNDLVYKTNKEKYDAVIQEVVQLVKAGRPVLVGTTSVQSSELLSRMLKLNNIPHNVLNAKQHAREAEIVAQAGQASQVTIATNMAGRGTDIKITEEVRKAGGLAIIGTERHESRRIDRQLRGRSGRQGDVGSSQFYVSLEDPLMRLFGSDRIANLMDRMGHKEGESLQHSMITKSIERAQKKVEENNFGIRKRLLEYDDVMNIQRKAIYQKRNNALYGERLEVEWNEILFQLAMDISQAYVQTRNYSQFEQDCIQYLAIDPRLNDKEKREVQNPRLAQFLFELISDHREQKAKHLLDIVMPVIEGIKNDPNAHYTRIAIPYTDGFRGLEIGVEIEQAIATEGQALIWEIERNILLAIIDHAWKEHLRNMDEMKDKVQNASFEQKDPLVLYKIEAYKLFEKLVDRINREAAAFLMHGMVPIRQEEAPPVDMEQVRQQIEQQKREQALQEQAAGDEEALKQQQSPRQQKVVEQPKIGRNDPCPCGSGKKYKNCHGQFQ
jgi:preprotein translocase subunit SecA